MKTSMGTALPIGISVNRHKVNVSVVAPKGAVCELLLYQKGERNASFCFPMVNSIGNLYHLEVEDKRIFSYEYNFRIDGEVMTDPYAHLVTDAPEEEPETLADALQIEENLRVDYRPDYLKGVEAKKRARRGVFLSDDFSWDGDEPLHLPDHEVVAYSLHVRGFTKDTYSGVRKKGTFQGVTEKIPYLQDLGINQIHLMPVYAFEDGENYKNYWGYGPAYPFSIRQEYAATRNPVKEVKSMVKSCHQAGIEVILEMPFDEGMSKLLMIHCIRYYRTQFHIDGFLLNPAVAPYDLILTDPVIAGAKILRHDTSFMDTMRRFLKGDENQVGGVIYHLRHLPKDTCNTITEQTGFTLYDLCSYEKKHNEENDENNRDGRTENYSWNCGVEGNTRKKSVLRIRKQQMRNALALLLLSQGTPCLLAGDECFNSQKGNNNAYCQDNPIGWVNWGKLRRDKELYSFIRELIRLRKAYPAFHPEKEASGYDIMKCGIPDVSYHGENAWQTPSEVTSRQLGVYYCGEAYGCEDLYVAYNMHWLGHAFALPSLPKGRTWEILFSTAQEDVKALTWLKDQKYLEAEPRTITVLRAV